MRKMSRSLLISVLISDSSGAAAFRFDGCLGRSRECVDFDIDLGRELAAAEDLDAIVFRSQAVLTENVQVDNRQFLFVGKRLEHIEIDAAVFHAVDVLEAELRQTALERHLATFMTALLRIARTRLRTFVATR